VENGTIVRPQTAPLAPVICASSFAEATSGISIAAQRNAGDAANDLRIRRLLFRG